MEIVQSGKHTLHGLNFYLSYFDDIAKVLPREDYCFIVGGWVRDRILGEPIGYNVDVDLLVTADPVKVAKAFAERIGGEFFVFEKKGFLIKRPVIATVVLNLPPYRYRFDFAQIKGKDLEKALEDDLRDRDFTANAMAVSLDDVLSVGAKQTIIFDPTGGIRDLEEGVLRPVSLENLKKDPVRILRGFRIALEKDLQLSEDFLDFSRKNTKIIKKAPPERITQELFKIMRAKRSSEVIRKLYREGILGQIIPEMERLKEIKDQGEHHIYPLDEHTFQTLSALEDILSGKVYSEEVKDLVKELGAKTFLGEFSDIELLKWGALFHDIGKPETFQIREGKVTFYNHDKVGQKIVEEVGKRLRWGEEATKFVSGLVRYHLRPFYLREALERGQLKDKGRVNFWRECGELTPHLFLLALADAIASGDTKEEIEMLLKTVEDLRRFREENAQKVEVKPLLNGYEIMEVLGIGPGKTIGEIKKALEEAQIEGKVKTKEEAVEFVKKFFKEGRC